MNLKEIKVGDFLKYVRKDGTIELDYIYSIESVGVHRFSEGLEALSYNGNNLFYVDKEVLEYNNSISLYKLQPDGSYKCIWELEKIVDKAHKAVKDLHEESWFVREFYDTEPDYLHELTTQKGPFKTKEDAYQFGKGYFCDYGLNVTYTYDLWNCETDESIDVEEYIKMRAE